MLYVQTVLSDKQGQALLALAQARGVSRYRLLKEAILEKLNTEPCKNGKEEARSR